MKNLIALTALKCVSCTKYKPILESLIEDGYDVKIIDVETNEGKGLCAKHGVNTLPVTLVYEASENVAVLTGVQSWESLKGLLS